LHYGPALVRARFRIQPSGQVEMLDDTPLADGLPPAAAHHGIWRWIPDAAPRPPEDQDGA
ncbi:MAG: hypothetical protein AAF565_19385, partial [Pseudomonadota bacterium]